MMRISVAPFWCDSIIGSIFQFWRKINGSREFIEDIEDITDRKNFLIKMDLMHARRKCAHLCVCAGVITGVRVHPRT